MRIITVDNGNTNPHVGIFQEQKLVSVVPLKDFSLLPDDFILVSDVGAPLPFAPSFDLKSIRSNNVEHNFFDMPVLYSKSLGADRLIGSYYIFHHLKPLERVLLIDAGTFITMDLINENGFSGGFIFPGINTFLDSFQKGAQLGRFDLRPDFHLEGLPHSTEEAILGAADNYLDSILESIIKKTSPSKIVLTGGSLEVIKNKILKLNSLKVQLDLIPHLLHSSLFLIHQHHLRPKAL